MTNEYPTNHKLITNDWSFLGPDVGIAFRRNERKKKCIGESGDIGDIAKIVNIAMQKNDMRQLRF